MVSLTELLNRPSSGRAKSRDEEHRLQCSCVRWFRLAHADIAHALFAVPNGGRRDASTGARLKAEGVIPGVSDLILLRPNDKYCALLLEMKTSEGRQSSSQRLWQRLITADNRYYYAVIRNFDDFRHIIEDYLNNEL